MKTLHILNGDSTAYTFSQTGIVGDTLVWRELLSEGPVSQKIDWNLRSLWMKENYSANEVDYQQKVISEVVRLQDISTFESIILWFEFDLVCQINLLYVLKSLAEKESLPSIFLICPDRFDGLPNFRGLGELSASQLSSLAPSKVQLTKKDLHLAAEAWDLYVENNTSNIVKFLENNLGNLTLLKSALEAHLSRLPNPETGLNRIEELLLEIMNAGVKTKAEIYKAFWKMAPIYGMGDSQIDHYLNRLKNRDN